MSWSGTTRRATLPPGWSSTIVPAVLARDPVCRCDGCPRCTSTGCRRASAEVDHAGDRLDHTKLRGICRPCHSQRTARQGAAAANARRDTAVRRRRHGEQHPGMQGPA